MKKIEDLNYYELLEVSPTATAQEIHKAYERIRRVYEPNSIALYSLMTPEETAVITQRIEEAYRTLVYEEQRRKYDAMLRGCHEHEGLPDLPPPQERKYQPPYVQPSLTLPSENRYLGAAETCAPQPAPVKSAPEPDAPVSPFLGEFTGPAIRMLREQKGLTLRHISDTTKINSRYLECIEEELFQKLPARAYIRGFLMLYAKTLGFDAERMSGDYLKRYDAVMKPVKK